MSRTPAFARPMEPAAPQRLAPQSTVGPQRVASMLNALLEGPLGTRPDLTMDALVARAVQSSGCAPPRAGAFEAPLQAVTQAATRATKLNALGRSMLATAVSMRLHTHFQIEDHLARHPEVLDEPIERPVLIVSLPRTGTTMLQRLLAVHPAHRVLRTWEMDRPVPGRARPAWMRRTKARASIALLHQLCPDLQHIHAVGADYPEECVNLFANVLHGFNFTLFYDLPGYVDYLHSVDMEPVYRAHRRQLQLLQAGGPRRRWVLKAPYHMLGLDALLKVYPDALIVQTHRDPMQLVASDASLFTSVRRAFHTELDPTQVGRERLGSLTTWCTRGMQARAQHSEDSFHDVAYSTLVRSPLDQVRAIADRLDAPLDPATAHAMELHLSRHRKGRHGTHRYSLAQVGLNAAEVKRRFTPYTHRFSRFIGPCS